MDDNKPQDINSTPVSEPTPQTSTPTMGPAVDTAAPSHDLAQDPSPQHTEPFQLPIQQPSHRKRPFMWVLIAIVIVAIAAGIWYFMVSSKQEVTNKAVTKSPVPTTVAAPNALATVDAVKEQKLQGAMLQVAKSDALSGETSDKIVAYGASFYQLAGKDFATDPKQAYGVAYHGTKAVSAADFQTITQYLTSHDFKSVTYPYPDNTTDINPMYVNAASFVSKTAFCTMNQQDYSKSYSPTAFKDTVTSVWCADLSSYSANVATLQPFFDAYTANSAYKKSSDPLATPVLSGLKVTDGIEGYKNATVNISAVGAIVGGVEGFFYQEPSKSWAFLKVTQDALYCSDLSTVALKKSFGNQTCIDNKTNTDIKVSTLL